jgi:mono/diheme cytochrome c family protein
MKWASAAFFPMAAMVILAGCNQQPEQDTSRLEALGQRPGLQASLIEDGRQAYTTYCLGCHGVNGDGNGTAAGFLYPRPRNFQVGNFKFSSTRAGKLPTDEDLKRTIRQGLKGSAMPNWPLLPEQTVDALVAYVKTFSPKWQERQRESAIPRLNDPFRAVADKSKAIQRGEMLYHGYANCWSCHPAYVAETKLNDYLEKMEVGRRASFRPGLYQAERTVTSEGEVIYPPDFKRDFLRAGTTIDDLYRSIAAGITSTAMPTWVDTMDVKSAHGGILVEQTDLWAIAYYVQSLVQQRPAKLSVGQIAVRERAQKLYFNGEIPPPVEIPKPATTGETFEEK